MVRIYGKTVNRWTHMDEVSGREFVTQLEIRYKEYRTDGSLYQVGTEDFSKDRYWNEILKRLIWTWDGKSYNKGGHRKFECEGMVTIRRSDLKDLKEYLKSQHPNASIIELR